MGKSCFVEKMCKDLNAEKISIDCSDIFDKWTGNSEKHASEIFDLAQVFLKRGKKCFIFFDEADALLSERDKSDDKTVTGVKSILLDKIERCRAGTFYDKHDGLEKKPFYLCCHKFSRQI